MTGLLISLLFVCVSVCVSRPCRSGGRRAGHGEALAGRRLSVAVWMLRGEQRRIVAIVVGLVLARRLHAAAPTARVRAPTVGRRAPEARELRGRPVLAPRRRGHGRALPPPAQRGRPPARAGEQSAVREAPLGRRRSRFVRR